MHTSDVLTFVYTKSLFVAKNTLAPFDRTLQNNETN